jgi:hypothetical protein
MQITFRRSPPEIWLEDNDTRSTRLARRELRAIFPPWRLRGGKFRNFQQFTNLNVPARLERETFNFHDTMKPPRARLYCRLVYYPLLGPRETKYGHHATSGSPRSPVANEIRGASLLNGGWSRLAETEGVRGGGRVFFAN